MISDKFLDGGLTLSSKKKIKFIKKTFREKGIILFKNIYKNHKDVLNFIDEVTLKYANDANRREIFFGKKNIRGVDLGSHEIPLHSESSFTSNWPEVIWFYCLKNSESQKGKTTICDGMKLWNELSINTKSYFLANPFCFELNLDIPKKNIKEKKWFFGEIGFDDTLIKYKEGKIKTKFTKFLVHKDKHRNKICFSNHIFSCIKNDEPQIKKFYPISKKKIPKKIINEIVQKSKNIIYEHKWEKFDLLMINNKRFLHGRREIDNLSDRKIINIQSLETKL